MPGRLARLSQIVRNEGVGAAARHILSGAHSRYMEWHLGIDTTGFITCQDLGVASQEAGAYSPTDYWGVKKALRLLRKGIPGGTFLDLGAGKGRVLVVAALYPFRRVIGVELSESLCAIARKNVELARKRLNCRNVHVVCADCSSYSVPYEVNHVYLI